MFDGSVNSAKMDFREIAEMLIVKAASGIVIMHNHTKGTAMPSITDVETTARMTSFFSAMDVDLPEHYVIKDGQIMGISEKSEFMLNSEKS